MWPCPRFDDPIRPIFGFVGLSRKAKSLLTGHPRNVPGTRVALVNDWQPDEEETVIVQIHTDPNIESSEALTRQVEALVASAVDRFANRISRVQVHLGDENSASKGGAFDKRCMIEARLEGRPPIAVTQQAATLEAAMDGAAAKLERSIDSMLGRLRDR